MLLVLNGFDLFTSLIAFATPDYLTTKMTKLVHKQGISEISSIGTADPTEFIMRQGVKCIDFF